MGNRSVRRRKKRINAYQAEHEISKYTTAARALDHERGQDDVLRIGLGGLQRGGEGKTSAEASFPLPDNTVLVHAAMWSTRKGSPYKTGASENLALALALAGGDPWTPIIIDTDTTASDTAALVRAWLVRQARSDDPARIAAWLARHGRVLTAAEHAVLAGLLSDPDPGRDPSQPDHDDEGHGPYLALLDRVLAGSGPPGPAVWPGADDVTSRLVVTLLKHWEIEHGPLIVDGAGTAISAPYQGNVTYRRVAAILISWVIEAAGSGDPQRITAYLAEFGFALTSAQQATLAGLLADTALRVPSGTRRTVLGPEHYLSLLGAVLSAPPSGSRH